MRYQNCRLTSREESIETHCCWESDESFSKSILLYTLRLLSFSIYGKPRTLENMAYFIESFLFGWGLGVRIMYLMLAGKTEIIKLNMQVDEN